MIQIVWEYVVKDENQGQFELTFGPGGAWSSLFAGCPGFRGTMLMRDAENHLRYLAIDNWDTLAQRDQTIAGCEAEYSRLVDSIGDWTRSGAEIGSFRVLADATVRPRGRAQRRASRVARRRRGSTP